MNCKTNNESVKKLCKIIQTVRYAELEKEKNYCLELIKIGKSTKDSYAIAFGYAYLGDYHIATGDLVKCGKYLYKSLDICKTKNYLSLSAFNHRLLGLLYERHNDEQNAFNNYLEALHLGEKMKSDKDRVIAYNNIASNFQNFGDYEEAYKYYKIAWDITKNIDLIGFENSYTTLLVNLAEISCDLGNYEEAAEYIKICEDSGFDKTANTFFVYVAKIKYTECKNPEGMRALAEEIFSSGIEYEEEKIFTCFVFEYLSKAFLKLNDMEYAKLALSGFERFLNYSDLHRWKLYNTLRVEYFLKCDDKENMLNAYKNFYEVICKSEELSHEVRANGLRAKMNLYTTMKEKEEALAHSEKMEKVANIDELTKVYNRRYLNKYIGCSFTTNEYKSVGLIMLDLDYFKEYNDTYGHQGGDLALKTVANVLKKYATSESVVGRFGGDEFTVICFDCSDDEIRDYIEKVRTEVKDKNICHKNSPISSKKLTLSVGYCNAKVENEINISQLLHIADKALYLSKFNGRDCVNAGEFEV